MEITGAEIAKVGCVFYAGAAGVKACRSFVDWWIVGFYMLLTDVRSHERGVLLRLPFT